MKTFLPCLAALILVTGCNSPSGGNGMSSSTQAHSNGGTSPNAPAGTLGGNGAGGTAGAGAGLPGTPGVPTTTGASAGVGGGYGGGR